MLNTGTKLKKTKKLDDLFRKSTEKDDKEWVNRGYSEKYNKTGRTPFSQGAKPKTTDRQAQLNEDEEKKRKSQAIGEYVQELARKNKDKAEAAKKALTFEGTKETTGENKIGSSYTVADYKKQTKNREQYGKLGLYDNSKDYRYQTDLGLQYNVDRLTGKAKEKQDEIAGLEKKKQLRDSYQPESAWEPVLDWINNWDKKNEEKILNSKSLGLDFKQNALRTLRQMSAGQEEARNTMTEKAHIFNLKNPNGIYRDEDDEEMRQILREQAYNQIMPEQYYDRWDKLTPEERKEFDLLVDNAINGIANPYHEDYDEQIKKLNSQANAFTQQAEAAQAEQKYRKDMQDFRGHANYLQDDATYNPSLIPEPIHTTTDMMDNYWEPRGSELDKAYFWMNNQDILGDAGNTPEHANKYMFVTDEQREMFNEFYAHDKANGTNYAESFLAGLDNYLRTSLSEYQDYYYRYKAEQPVTGAVSRLMTYPVQAVNGITNMIAAGAAFLGDKNAQDPNSGWHQGTKFVESTREQQNQNFANWAGETFGDWAAEPAQFAANVVDSIADNLFAIETGKALSPNNADRAQRLIQMVMSGGATGHTMLEELNNGTDPTEAVLRAVGSGAIEWITEKYSLDELLKPDVRSMLGNKKQLAQYLAKVTAAEGSEEINSDLLNMALDQVLSMVYGHETELEKAYNDLVADGMDPTEASRQVLMNKLQEIGMSGLAGAISGGLMGGGRIAANAVTQAGIGKQIRANISENGNEMDPVRSLVDTGLSLDAGTQSNQQAQELKEAGESGKKISNRRIGRLAQNIQVEGDADALHSVADLVTGRKTVNVKTVDAESVGEQMATEEDIRTAEGERTGGSREVILDGKYGKLTGLVQTEDGLKYRVDVGGETKTADASEIRATDFATASVMRQQAADPGLFGQGYTNQVLQEIESGNIKNAGDLLTAATQIRYAAFTGQSLPRTSLPAQTAQRLYDFTRAERNNIRMKETSAGQRNALKPGEGRATFKGAEYGTEAFDKAIADLSKTEQDRITTSAEVAKRFGIELTFVDKEQVAAENEEFRNLPGSFYGSESKSGIQLNIEGEEYSRDENGQRKVTGRHHIGVAFGHEATHWLQRNSMEGYDRLERFVFDTLRREHGTQYVNTRISEVMQRQGLDIAGAMSEIVADSCDQILGSEAVMQHIQETDTTLFGQIKSFVKNLVERMKTAARGMSESASRDAVMMFRHTNELARIWLGAYDEALSGTVAAMEENGNDTRLSVAELPDGTKYVEIDTDQEQFDGLNPQQIIRKAKDIILNKYQGMTFDFKNGSAKVLRKTAKEYSWIKNLRRAANYQGEIAAKGRASTELENLINVSTLLRPGEEGYPKESVGHHLGDIVIKGWDYYKTRFRVNGTMYTGVLNIVKLENYNLIYDLTQIKKDTGATTHAGRAGGATSNVYSRNIAQNDTNSNTRNSVAEMNRQYEEAYKNGDRELGAQLVAEAARKAGYTLKVFHGTGEYFNEFRRGYEGIHLGNREQAEQVANTRFEWRSKNTRYFWGDVKDSIENMDNEQRSSLVNVAYRLQDYFDDGLSVPPFDGDIADTKAVKAYAESILRRYANENGIRPDNILIEMRTFGRKTGKHVMNLYSKINNPFIINGDIGQWDPASIADVILKRNEGEESARVFGYENDVDISGSEITLTEEQKTQLERISGSKIKDTEEMWDALSNVLEQLGFDGIQYLNKYEGDKNSYSYIALRQSDVKSAEPFEKDDSGNLIPLSERFNKKKADIRYSSAEMNRQYEEAYSNGDRELGAQLVAEAARKAGYTIRAYHGTSRADRVGNVFRPDRATSGPMAFFTDNREIAENYARDKKDTSIAYDEEYGDYFSQFRVKNKRGKSVPVGDLWNEMSYRDRQRVLEAGKHITWDEDVENIIYDPNADVGNGGFQDWSLREHKGNAINTLIEAWLNSGDLYNQEGRFLDVLRLAGIEGVEWNNPDARDEKVYDTFLRIQKPFNTGEMYNEDFLQRLESWWEEQDPEKYEKLTANADPWDKNNRSLEDWIETARQEIRDGSTRAWTSIPDAVTDFLKSEGYDGIQDTGGKNGGREHTVWIPFSSEQVKSAEPFAKDDSGTLIPLNKRFNKKKVDIRYSHADPEVRKYLSTWARNHVQENYDLRDEILAKYGIKSGTTQLGESGQQMTKADRNRLQQIEREIEKWEQKQVEAMGLDEEDLGAQYVTAWKNDDKARMEEILMEKLNSTEGVIPYKAPVWYDSARHRQIANLLKENNPEAVMYASVEMAALVPENAVLIPMPPHTGKVTDTTDTMVLAQAISKLTGRPVLNALEGAERERRKDTKNTGGRLDADALGFRQIAEIPEGMIPYFIDNVVGSGVTAQAAHNAIGSGITLAYAKSTRAAIDGLKNASNTFGDKYQTTLIPLDARFDMDKTGVKGTKFSSADEFSADVNAWMSNISVSSLQTEDERQLWQAWKGKRLEIQLSLKRQMDYQAKLKRLQNAESLTAAERDEMTALENKIEIQKQKYDRLQEEMYQITSTEGYAGMMYQQNTVLQDFIYGRTQEQMREAVEQMMQEVEQARKEIDRRTAELDRLAKTEAVKSMRRLMKDTSLGMMASMLKSEYSSGMSETEIGSRLAEMALRQIRGEGITEDVEALAADLINKMRGVSRESLDIFRGRTFAIGESTLQELHAENSNMREIRSALKGSGVKIVVEPKSRLQEQWNEIREYDQSLPDIDGIAEIDKLHEVVDYIATLMRNNNGGEQFGVDRNEVAQMVQAAAASVVTYMTEDTEARQQIERLLTSKRDGKAGEIAASMDQIQERMKTVIEAGHRAKNWTNVLESDVQTALNYYNTTARVAAEEERNKVRKRLLEQLRSENMRKLNEQRDKYEKQMKEDRKARLLAQDNAALRSKVTTVTKRLGRLLTMETDLKNIPEEAKPLARIMLRMIARNDFNGNRKVTTIEHSQLERLMQVLDAFDKRDGEFKPEDLDWLVTGEGEGADYEIRDKVAANLQNIESGIIEYVAAEGMKNVSLMDRKNALSRIQKAATEIYEIIRARQMVEIDGKKMLAEEIALQVQDDMEKSRFKGEFTGKIGKGIGAVRGGVIVGNMTPEYFFKNLRNKTLSQLYNEYHTAENRAGLEYGRAKRRIEQIAKDTGYGSWDLEKRHTLHLKKGGDVQLNLEQMMQLYATWKREAALQNSETDTEKTFHLGKGGFYVENDEKHKIAGREIFRQRSYRMMPEDFEALSEMLTDQQKEYADRIVSYLSNEMSELGNEASMRMYGIKKYNERYYFPFEIWSGVKAVKSDSGAGGSKESQRGAHPGFSNRLRNNASNALMIRGFTQMATKHIVGMINYNTFAPAIEFVQRVMNQQTTTTEGDNITQRNLWAAFGEAYGKDALDYFQNFQKDINGGTTRPDRTFYDKLLSTFRKSAVAGSVSVALQQPLSYIRAGIMINPVYLTGAFGKQLRGAAAEMEKWSGVAVLKKMGKFDMGIGASAQEFLTPEARENIGRTVYNKAADVATKLPEMLDQATWTRIWVACKLEQKAKHPDLKTDSEEFLTAVAERFNDVLRKTQVYDSTLVRSRNMRNTNPIIKGLTSFMAEPTLTANVLADAVANVREKGGAGKLARAAAAFLLSAIAQALVKGIMGAGRNPDEKKTWDENNAYRFMYNFINEVNPLSLIPGYGDLIALLKKGEVSDDASSVVGKIMTAVKTGNKLVTGQSENVYRDVEDSVGILAQLFSNIPAKNLARDARAIYNFFTQPYAQRENNAGILKYQTMGLIMTADNLLGAVNEMTGKSLYGTSNTAYYQRIYDAKKAGDETAVQQMTDYLTLGKGVEKKTINSNINTLTRKDEDVPAAERAKALMDNGYGSMTEFIKEQYKKGEITRKEAERLMAEADPKKTKEKIAEALDSVDWKNAGNDAENYTNYTPLYDAISTGNTSAYSAAKKKLIGYGFKEDDIESKTKTFILQQYKEGKATKAQAESMLKKFRKDLDGNDIWWELDRADYAKQTGESVTGNYYRLYDAIEANKSDQIKTAVKQMVEHGFDNERIKKAITSKYKQQYLGLKAGSEKTKLMDALTKAYKAVGLSANEALKIINGWKTK